MKETEGETTPMRMIALTLAAAAAAAPAAADFVPLSEAMKQKPPAEYALTRCAGQSRATAEWIAEHGEMGDVAEGLAQRAAAFESAAARVYDAAAEDVDLAVEDWRSRFEASGRDGDAAWRSDPLWAKDMQVCDEIADAAR
jgi:hypothetical protein